MHSCRKILLRLLDPLAVMAKSMNLTVAHYPQFRDNDSSDRLSCTARLLRTRIIQYPARNDRETVSDSWPMMTLFDIFQRLAFGQLENVSLLFGNSRNLEKACKKVSVHSNDPDTNVRVICQSDNRNHSV